MIDLTTLEAEATPTYEVPVVFNADATPAAGFMVVGKNAPQYQAQRRLIALQGIKRSAVRGKKLDTKTNAGAEELVDSFDSNETALAIACVVSWYGFTNPELMTPDALAKVFAARPTWREKVLDAIETDANFSQS